MTNRELARDLRKHMTLPERRLWRALRGRALGGKFRRQEPIGDFIVDFVCFEARLVVEVDGGQHCGSERDAVRDAWLSGAGYRVVRFWNHEVISNLEGVLVVIAEQLKASSSTRQPRNER